MRPDACATETARSIASEHGAPTLLNRRINFQPLATNTGLWEALFQPGSFSRSGTWKGTGHRSERCRRFNFFRTNLSETESKDRKSKQWARFQERERERERDFSWAALRFVTYTSRRIKAAEPGKEPTEWKRNHSVQAPFTGPMKKRLKDLMTD